MIAIAENRSVEGGSGGVRRSIGGETNQCLMGGNRAPWSRDRKPSFREKIGWIVRRPPLRETPRNVRAAHANPVAQARNMYSFGTEEGGLVRSGIRHDSEATYKLITPQGFVAAKRLDETAVIALNRGGYGTTRHLVVVGTGGRPSAQARACVSQCPLTPTAP